MTEEQQVAESGIYLPNIMLDLETLGTGDHAPIIQVAAVRFHWEDVEGDEPEGYREFKMNVRMTNDDAFGRIDPQTMLWWLQQEPAARDSAFCQDEAYHISDVIRSFHMWLAVDKEEPLLWADSPNFDVRLLRQACERVGHQWLFSHRSERCYRTLKREFGIEEDKSQREGVEHDALDDARHQARIACAIMRRLKGATGSVTT